MKQLIEWTKQLPYADVEILSNSLYQWCIACLAFLLLVIIVRLLRSVVTKKLQSLTKLTENDMDDVIAHCLEGTHVLFILILSGYIASRLLALPDGIASRLFSIFVIATLIQGGIWVSRLVVGIITEHISNKQSEDPSSSSALGLVTFIARLGIWASVILLMLDNIGIDITALVAGLGVGGIAVALAVQNVLGDLFGSLSIILDKPFAVGDFVIVDSYMGTVERIGIKTTRVRSISGEQLIFSNSDLLGSRIRNYKRMYERRVVFSIGVIYQTPLEHLKMIPEILKNAVSDQEHIRFDRAHLSKLNDSSIDFETVYYVLQPDYALYMDIQQAIYLTVMKQFKDLGIEFAYPTQTLFIEHEDQEPTAEADDKAA